MLDILMTNYPSFFVPGRAARRASDGVAEPTVSRNG
jgi:hypothetical protein